MDTNIKEYGRLYGVATPIGNLKDISLRAIEVLEAVDFIACEDTRNTVKLLNYYNIHKPLTSYHEHNKIEKAYEIIKEVKRGRDCAFVTDAGMPAISDPGEELVRIAREEGVEISIIPGASACLCAVALSGLSSRSFVFEGFIPVEKKNRKKVMERLKSEERTIVIYEAPHRLVKTLKELKIIFGAGRRLSLVREITKKYEEVLATDFKEMVSLCDEGGYLPRGEYVLVIEGKPESEAMADIALLWKDIDIVSHLNLYLDQGLDKKAAIKQVAKDKGVSKREIYNYLVK